jgi:hypothetical protein
MVLSLKPMGPACKVGLIHTRPLTKILIRSFFILIFQNHKGICILKKCRRTKARKDQAMGGLKLVRGSALWNDAISVFGEFACFGNPATSITKGSTINTGQAAWHKACELQQSWLVACIVWGASWHGACEAVVAISILAICTLITPPAKLCTGSRQMRKAKKMRRIVIVLSVMGLSLSGRRQKPKRERIGR